jgi:hypothetical protein
MILVPYRRPLALLTALGLVLAAAAAPKWNTLQAPHCLIVSQLSEKETRAWAGEFEQFASALRNKISIDERFLPPLTVVLFSDSRVFRPYCPPGVDGKPRDVGGFCSSHESWAVIGLSEGFSDERTRHVVLHETTHWHISATPTEFPLWLNEGAAEAFSTFKPEKTDGLFGEPVPENLVALRDETWLPLLQLLATNHRSPIYNDNRRCHIFYAQSWLFVHKLLFENPAAGHEILNRFYAALVRGSSQSEAMETAAGKSLDELDGELQRYARSGRFTFLKIPVPPEAKVAAPFRPAPPAVVETALARLAYSSLHHDLARTHIAKALAADPATLAPQELLATLEFEKDNHAEAEAAARRCIAAGSRDAMMHIIVAQTLWKRHNDQRTLDTAAREIVDHYAQALALQPKLRVAYTNVARIAPALQAPTLSDAQLLISGYKLFPDEPEILIGIAALQHKAGDDNGAAQMLDRALARPELLTDAQRANADRLRTEWKIEPLRRRLETLTKERRFAEALEICEQILQLPLQIRAREPWEKRRTELRFRITLDDARRTGNDGRHAEAVGKLEALVATPELNERQRAQARQMLDIMKRGQAATNPASESHTQEENP